MSMITNSIIGRGDCDCELAQLLILYVIITFIIIFSSLVSGVTLFLCFFFLLLNRHCDQERGRELTSLD